MRHFLLKRLILLPRTHFRHFSHSTPVHQTLRGRTALITGASRGIGLAIAQRFALEGATCVIIGRNRETLECVRKSLDTTVQIGEREHRTIVGDVGEVAFWESQIRNEKKFDLLVNAAGITHYSPLFVTQQALIEKVLDTNLMGTMMACRTVGKKMLGSTGGCIINIASLLGVKGGKGSTAYAASKAGVIGLTRALAAELGERHIRVNVIVPGYINTDMTEAMTPEAHSNALNSIPLKRFGESSEIADAALFLAANKYANNCVLNLDGGLSAT